MRYSAIVALAFIVLIQGAAAGQTVHGSAREQGTLTPLRSAMIILVDDAGAERARTLTDGDGRFALRAPAAGRYTLRLELIGFRNIVSAPFDLGAGDTMERDIDAPLQAVALEPINVESRRRCIIRPGEGLAIATLWEEARKALAATAFTQEQRTFGYRVQHFDRRLDMGTLRILRDSSTSTFAYIDGSPFRSAPAERLVRDGFILPDDDGTTLFHGPDAHVLLSDVFLDAYCFRVANPTGDGLIGIAFQPSERRGPAAVRGTLWLDSATFALRHVDFAYTRARLPDGPVEQLGGRVEFERLPTGLWIVRRWRIRMPVSAVRSQPWRAPGLRSGIAMVGIQEQGGEVVEVVSARGALVSSSVRGSLRGIAFDSVSAAPLAGAAVHLAGSSYNAIADESGRYVIDNVSAGEYTVLLTHPRLALYGLESLERPVTLPESTALELNLAVPSSAAAGGLAARCPAIAPGAPRRGGLLSGTVRDELTGVSLPGAVLHLSWQEPADSVVVTAGSDGSFTACGLPEDRTITARVRHFGRTSAPRSLDELGRAGFAQIDLSLPLSQPVPVAVHLRDRDTGEPVVGAGVSVPALDLTTVSDRSGRVSFASLPPGAHTLVVEHTGFGRNTHDFEVGAAAVTLDVRVPASAIALRELEVTVRSPVAETRRLRGSRMDIMTRDDIASLEQSAEHVGHLVQRFPGLMVQETYSGIGGVRSGLCIQSRRGRSISSSGCEPVMILLDDIPIADTNVLMSLSPNAIESVEYIGAAEAGARYGTGTARGVLIIYTRGRGPYHQQKR